MKKQVDKRAYDFNNYCPIERWDSYWHQLKIIIGQNPESVLEIGVGDGALGDYIKRNTEILYKSLDIAEDVNPDIVGSVDNLPFKDKSFDIVCAYEVLEHLPFDKLEDSLKELKRVAKKRVVISLPHWGRHFSFEIRLPLLKKIRCQFKFSFPKIKHKFNGEHYWEIGKRDYPLKKVRKIIQESGFKILDDYSAFESPYHHFFILELE